MTASGEHRYRVDHHSSSIRILVFRDGLLRILGHNHVIRVPELEGEIIADKAHPNHARFRIKIPVRKLDVDVPDDRRQAGAGFDSEVGPSAAIATKQNMLGPKVLDANKYPYIQITGMAGKTAQGVRANSHICIRNHCIDYKIPLEIRRSETAIVATGDLTILQSDHGIVPYSLLGGALRTRDKIRILFTIIARPKTGDIK